MKRIYRIVSVVSLAVLSATTSFAQDDLEELLNRSLDDGKKLVKGYVSPFMNSVSLGLNQGWYNTAAPHKIGGIDITVTANAMNIPKSDLFFDVSKLGLEVVQLDDQSPDYPLMPTIVGPDRPPVFRYTDEDSGLTETYEGPGGLDLEAELGKNWVPVPMANVGIGLPKGTDLKLRFTPTLDLGDDATLKLFGIGVMHNIKQWIPGIKMLPFDLSGFVGYTKLKLEAQLDADANPDQIGVFELNATTIQGLISKKLSILTVYGGAGYNIAKSNLALKGTYDINDNGEVDANEVDPVDLKFASSGFRATAGMRLKLAILTLHADYTVQKYKCLTVGVGLSVR